MAHNSDRGRRPMSFTLDVPPKHERDRRVPTVPTQLPRSGLVQRHLTPPTPHRCHDHDTSAHCTGPGATGSSRALKNILNVPYDCPRYSGRNPNIVTRPAPNAMSAAATFPASLAGACRNPLIRIASGCDGYRAITRAGEPAGNSSDVEFTKYSADESAIPLPTGCFGSTSTRRIEPGA